MLRKPICLKPEVLLEFFARDTEVSRNFAKRFIHTIYGTNTEDFENFELLHAKCYSLEENESVPDFNIERKYLVYEFVFNCEKPNIDQTKCIVIRYRVPLRYSEDYDGNYGEWKERLIVVNEHYVPDMYDKTAYLMFILIGGDFVRRREIDLSEFQHHDYENGLIGQKELIDLAFLVVKDESILNKIYAGDQVMLDVVREIKQIESELK